MKEQIISFKLAKLAKEKGFPQEPTQLRESYYNYKGELNGDVKDYIKHRFACRDKGIDPNIPSEYDSIKAPTQSLLQKWLREKHNLNVYCMPCDHNESLWFNNIASHIPVFTGTYEEALEKGLEEGFKLI